MGAAATASHRGRAGSATVPQQASLGTVALEARAVLESYRRRGWEIGAAPAGWHPFEAPVPQSWEGVVHRRGSASAVDPSDVANRGGRARPLLPVGGNGGWARRRPAAVAQWDTERNAGHDSVQVPWGDSTVAWLWVCVAGHRWQEPVAGTGR